MVSELHRANDKHPLPICSTGLPLQQPALPRTAGGPGPEPSLAVRVYTSPRRRLSVIRRTDFVVGFNLTDPPAGPGPEDLAEMMVLAAVEPGERQADVPFLDQETRRCQGFF